MRGNHTPESIGDRGIITFLRRLVLLGRSISLAHRNTEIARESRVWVRELRVILIELEQDDDASRSGPSS